MDHFLDIDGIRTRYRRLGAGPDVLVLHGWAARIESMAPILDGLAPALTVHAVDLPGFGESAPPPRQPWGHDDYVAWTRTLIASLGLERPSVIGHSRGGAIALKLAAEHPELVDRLILVDSAGIRARRTLRYYRRVAVAKFAKHVLRRLGPLGRRAQARLAARSASGDYARAGAMRPTLARLVNEDLSASLPSVRAPTLLIWGAGDEATPVSDGRAMERLIPDAGLVVFDRAGHFAYLDEPQRFNAIASHFLAPPPSVPVA